MAILLACFVDFSEFRWEKFEDAFYLFLLSGWSTSFPPLSVVLKGFLKGWQVFIMFCFLHIFVIRGLDGAFLMALRFLHVFAIW